MHITQPWSHMVVWRGAEGSGFAFNRHRLLFLEVDTNLLYISLLSSAVSLEKHHNILDTDIVSYHLSIGRGVAKRRISSVPTEGEYTYFAQ